MIIDTLLDQGIDASLVAKWKADGIKTLTECQQRALSHDALWAGKNILVVAPTSSGKTFAGEVLAAKAALSLKRSILLVPFKAIAEEKYAEFRDRYEDLGISVVISDGDHTDFDRDIRRGDFGIAVIVYEKMAQLLIQSPGILVNCAIIVVDEIQMIADRNRGPSLEILLTHIRQLQEQPQIVGLSATLSDVGGIDSWLDADVIHCDERPVPLWESVATENGTTALENVESNEQRPGLDLASVAVPSSGWSPGSKSEIAYRILVAEGLDKQALVFRTRVDDTAATAKDLAYVLPVDPVPTEVRGRIGSLEQTRVRDFLSQWIDKRVAYHNAGLSLEERRLIEELFNQSIIRTLITTSTLAAGINTPADIVIVLDHKRWDSARRTNVGIEIEEYKNSVGRAGRLGVTSEGHSYLVVEREHEAKLMRGHYVLGKPKRLQSAIPHSPDIGALVLSLLSLALISDENVLRRSICGSFAYSHYLASSSDRDAFVTEFMDSFADIELAGLIRRDTHGIKVTDLGKVASSSGASLESFYTLLRVVKDPDIEKDLSGLASIICDLDEFQSIRPYDSHARAGVLCDWVNGRPVSEIIELYSDDYEVGSGHVRRIGETAAWFLRTAARVARIPDLVAEGEAIGKALDEIAERSRFGVPSEVLDIAELRALDRSELNLLVNNSAGVQLVNRHQILDTPLEQFAGILSPQRARRLKSAIVRRIGESLANRRFGHVVRADNFPGIRVLVERCYDFDGEALEIAVEELLNGCFPRLGVNRFAQQRTGQPDLEIEYDEGTIVIQVTASRDDKKPVNWAKARDVVSSVGYSGEAVNFVTIARAEFHDVAIGNAKEMAERGDQRLLLIALPEFVELCLSELEETIPGGSVVRFLATVRGHLTLEAIDDAAECIGATETDRC